MLGEDVTEVQVAASDGQHCELANWCGMEYYKQDISHKTKRSSCQLHSFLKARGTILSKGITNSKECKLFLDGGATFDAISPELCTEMEYEVETFDTPLQLTLGTSQRIAVERKVTKICLELPSFPLYEAHAFVMTIPEGHDIHHGIAQ